MRWPGRLDKHRRSDGVYDLICKENVIFGGFESRYRFLFKGI
jgi:hypothetical protein